MINHIDRSSIVFGEFRQCPSVTDDSLTVFFPVDNIGKPCDLSGAYRLEAWGMREGARRHAPDILMEGWRHALVRQDETGKYFHLTHLVAKASIAVAVEWTKSMVRVTEADLYIRKEKEHVK